MGEKRDGEGREVVVVVRGVPLTIEAKGIFENCLGGHPGKKDERPPPKKRSIIPV